MAAHDTHFHPFFFIVCRPRIHSRQLVVGRVYAAHMHERLLVIFAGEDLVNFLRIHHLSQLAVTELICHGLFGPVRVRQSGGTGAGQLIARDFAALEAFEILDARRSRRDASSVVLRLFQASAAFMMPNPRL